MSPTKDKKSFAGVDSKDSARERVLTVTELAFYAGTSTETITQMVEHHLISPCTADPEPCFPTDILPPVRRILRLHRFVGVDISSLPLVLELLSRIEQLEDQLARLSDDGSRKPPR